MEKKLYLLDPLTAEVYHFIFKHPQLKLCYEFTRTVIKSFTYNH